MGIGGTRRRRSAARFAVATPAAANQGTLQAARAVLAGSQLGRDILQRMDRAGATVRVLSDQEFRARFPGAVGVFLPDSDSILMPQSALRDATRGALTIAHEGIHFLQDRFGLAGLALSGGAIGTAIQGAHATGTGGRSSHHFEAQAYVLEALVSQELGVRDDGLGVSVTGALLTYQQTLDAVRRNPAYQ